MANRKTDIFHSWYWVIVFLLMFVSCIQGHSMYEEPCVTTDDCMTYNGTVSCVNYTCSCNLGEDAVFEVHPYNQCVSLVGGICYPQSIPELGVQHCVKNAECSTGGGFLGNCRCLPDFISDQAKRCVLNMSGTSTTPGLPEPSTDLSTLNTDETTLSSPPITTDKEISEFGEPCVTSDDCMAYDGTVSCVNYTCSCNLGEDAIFEVDPYNQCVSLVGGICFSPNIPGLGVQNCIKNAECNVGGGFLGNCKCLPDFISNHERRCVLEISSTSTTPDSPEPTTDLLTTSNTDETTISSASITTDETTISSAPITTDETTISSSPTTTDKEISEFGGPCATTDDCMPYDGTVSCINYICSCNLREDAVFEVDPYNQCVSLVGGICFSPNIPGLGIQNCIKNAECNVGGGFLGNCKCLPEFISNHEKRCVEAFPPGQIV